MDRSKIYRIIDANLNRSQEGLRVCEEVVRFVLDDSELTEELKKLKYKITRIAKLLPVATKELLAARESDTDVGRDMAGQGAGRNGYEDVFMANIGRVKESLRVLEELAKLIDTNTASRDFQSARFTAYALEKKAVERLQALCDIR